MSTTVLPLKTSVYFTPLTVYRFVPLTHLPRNDIPSGILSSNVTFLRATYFVPAVCDDRANQFFEKPCIRPMRPENARIRLPTGLASPELGCTAAAEIEQA